MQRASFDPVIDGNYFARAEKSNEDDLSTPEAKYILSFYIVGIVFAAIVAVMILLIYLNTKRWDRKLGSAGKTTKANKYTQSKIFSIAATSFFVNIYAIVLDTLAVITVERKEVIIEEHYVNALPYYVIGVDIIGALIWTCCWTFSCCSFLFRQHKEYIGLALSTLGPTLSLIVHLPYITIAYLNDASYATSIFIYYIITVFVLFGVLDLTYGTCQGAIIHAKRRQDPEQVTDEGCFFCCPKSPSGRRCIFIFIIPFFTLVILCFACMITAALVTIPISKAFSDIPSRLLGFYQTAIVLVGAYLIYQNFFKKRPSIESAIKEREDFIPTKMIRSRGEWEQLSKDEKVEQFYSRFVDIVANYRIGDQVPGLVTADSTLNEEQRQSEPGGEQVGNLRGASASSSPTAGQMDKETVHPDEEKPLLLPEGHD